jgi:hypothetical protein
MILAKIKRMVKIYLTKNIPGNMGIKKENENEKLF